MKPNHRDRNNKRKENTTDRFEALTFQDIYGAILKKTDLTRGELSFLRRVIQRRLRDGNLYLEKEDFIFRPYRHLFYM